MLEQPRSVRALLEPISGMARCEEDSVNGDPVPSGTHFKGGVLCIGGFDVDYLKRFEIDRYPVDRPQELHIAIKDVPQGKPMKKALGHVSGIEIKLGIAGLVVPSPAPLDEGRTQARGQELRLVGAALVGSKSDLAGDSIHVARGRLRVAVRHAGAKPAASLEDRYL